MALQNRQHNAIIQTLVRHGADDLLFREIFDLLDIEYKYIPLFWDYVQDCRNHIDDL